MSSYSRQSSSHYTICQTAIRNYKLLVGSVFFCFVADSPIQTSPCYSIVSSGVGTCNAVLHLSFPSFHNDVTSLNDVSAITVCSSSLSRNVEEWFLLFFPPYSLGFVLSLLKGHVMSWGWVERGGLLPSERERERTRFLEAYFLSVGSCSVGHLLAHSKCLLVSVEIDERSCGWMERAGGKNMQK